MLATRFSKKILAEKRKEINWATVTLITPPSHNKNGQKKKKKKSQLATVHEPLRFCNGTHVDCPTKRHTTPCHQWDFTPNPRSPQTLMRSPRRSRKRKK